MTGETLQRLDFALVMAQADAKKIHDQCTCALKVIPHNKSQSRAEADNAKRRHPLGRQSPQMAALQNSRVKNPDRKRADDLQPWQRLADEEAADQAKRVKSESPPEQAA